MVSGMEAAIARWRFESGGRSAFRDAKSPDLDGGNASSRRPTQYTEAPSVLQEERESNRAIMGETAKTTRRPRADRVRNRERLLTAAAAVFSAGGPEA